MFRVVEMFPQVAAKHSLFEDAALPQLLWWWSRLHERPQECYQLPMLLTH